MNKIEKCRMIIRYAKNISKLESRIIDKRIEPDYSIMRNMPIKNTNKFPVGINAINYYKRQIKQLESELDKL